MQASACVCMSVCRGMQCTSYVKMAPGVTVDDLHAHLSKMYADEFFVKVRVLYTPDMLADAVNVAW